MPAMRDRTVGLQVFAAAVCVTASFVAASCGSKDTKTSTIHSSPAVSVLSSYANIVTSSEIAKTADGSPQRALLEWFQAVQFRDLGQVGRLTASPKATHVSPAALDSAVQNVGPSLAFPRVVQSRVSGDSASVRVLLLTYKAGTTILTSSLPATFTLTRPHGSWLVSDVSVLFPNGERKSRSHR
jgi:hypothetical protein